MMDLLRSRKFWFGLVLGGVLGILPGFGLGVYYLPILLEEEGPTAAELERIKDMAAQAEAPPPLENVKPKPNRPKVRRARSQKPAKPKIRKGVFTRDLEDSDWLHWGEGEFILSKEKDGVYVTLIGALAPGPDYYLYFVPRFVETEKDFLAIKAKSVRTVRINSFKNFRYKLPQGVKSDDYPAVLIWCERFSEFITATRIK